ncbi:MAG: hypothetical protein AB8U25_07510 [Rickettsiales endosymbiont of Dermacentor nuttalli]
MEMDIIRLNLKSDNNISIEILDYRKLEEEVEENTYELLKPYKIINELENLSDEILREIIKSSELQGNLVEDFLDSPIMNVRTTKLKNKLEPRANQ